MKYLVLALTLATISSQTSATPVTFTGAELANLPGVTFPSGTQSIIGNGLRLENLTGDGVIYRLPLDGFSIDPTNIGLSISYEQSLRTDGIADQDLFLGIYDGAHYFSSVAIDFFPEMLELQNRVSILSVAEDRLATRTFREIGPHLTFNTGTTAQFDVSIQATPSGTLISGAFNGSGPFVSSTPTLFDSGGNLSLLIAGNSPGENFLINSLTFTSGLSGPTAISEPSMFGGLALGLMTLGLYRRRRR